GDRLQRAGRESLPRIGLGSGGLAPSQGFGEPFPGGRVGAFGQGRLGLNQRMDQRICLRRRLRWQHVGLFEHREQGHDVPDERAAGLPGGGRDPESTRDSEGHQSYHELTRASSACPPFCSFQGQSGYFESSRRCAAVIVPASRVTRVIGSESSTLHSEVLVISVRISSRVSHKYSKAWN